MAQIDDLLRYLREHKGSDLHLAAGLEPRIRVNGELRAVENMPRLDDAGLRKLMREIATETQWAGFEEKCDLDFAYGLEGVARFRANFFVQLPRYFGLLWAARLARHTRRNLFRRR